MPQAVQRAVRSDSLCGQEQCILVHLEIQSSYEEAFASRISRYNAGIHRMLIQNNPNTFSPEVVKGYHAGARQ